MKFRSRKRIVNHVRLDSNACIGCVACTRCENFEMGEDMRAHLVEDETCVLEAIANCPVGAIDLLPLPEFFHDACGDFFVG
jgi:ferredoxin